MGVHPFPNLGSNASAGFRVQEVCGAHLNGGCTGHDELQRIAAGQDAAQPDDRDIDGPHSLPHHAQCNGADGRAGKPGKGVVEHRAALFQINGAGLEGIAQADAIGTGSFHGLVTGILHPEQFAMVLTCGPMVMMRGVYQLGAQSGTPCVASLERKMACGLGACLGCTCRTKVGAKTVCKDGPVFKAEEVFD